MLRRQIGDRVGAEVFLLTQEPLQPGALCRSGCLAGPVIRHVSHVETDQIAKCRALRCALVDELAPVHFAFDLTRPGLRVLLCAEGGALIRPALTPDLYGPLVWAFLADRCHYRHSRAETGVPKLCQIILSTDWSH